MNRVTRLTALVATSCLALASPAIAQTAQEEARFEQAQTRFQNELSIFRTEFDRYQQARANRPVYRDPRGGDPRYNDPRYNDPRYNGTSFNDERDEGNYDPARYYRNDARYQERVLAADDRVYRGNDGRYYCKRNDGTTGLIVGALGGGLLGNVIQGGRSRTVGTLVGGALGAVIGKSVDQNSQEIKCR
ncbi:MAG: hypothetical protein B7Y45_02200 [Sphingomonas sp. 28-66-16]|nr:MAG: hypothetical protein B7Y45_02200 [Sphingomonas sp. 28-66-16]